MRQQLLRRVPSLVVSVRDDLERASYLQRSRHEVAQQFSANTNPPSWRLQATNPSGKVVPLVRGRGAAQDAHKENHAA
jgi:hypothetical protein